ncbi:MAG TPA: NAD-dependent epimerase/dehydratase family protein, partial [Rhodospirillales bacterium]|nr:NAD-dependent epimerase/dehydratase family protein [Rhodospirillales bacterium]
LFHVAADYRLWTRNPQAMFRANVQGTRDILRAARDAGAERIVYTSSVAVLGARTDGVAVGEDASAAFTDMIGPYKQSKFLAEEEARRLVSEEGVPAVIVNPSTPIGPRDLKPTPTGRLIVEAARGKMPAYVDTGLNLVHVDDVAEGHMLAFEKGKIGARYVLGGEDMELRDILAEIARLTGGKPPRVRIPHAAILPIAYVAEAWTRLSGGGEPFVTVDGVKMARKKMFFSSAKARKELGFNPRPAASGLKDAIAWFTENGYCSLNKQRK